MRPPTIPLIATLSVLLLLSCILSSATGLVSQQHSGLHRVVHRNAFIEARQPYGNALADDYGPPPPYYTGEPTVPTDLTSYLSLEEPTATKTQTGFSEAGTTFKSNVSTQYDTASSGSSSFSAPSALETDTVMITAGSSAKAGSTSSSEVPSTAHLTPSDSSQEIESASAEVSAISGNNSSLVGTHSSVGTDIVSNPTMMTGTASLETETIYPFTSASYVAVSSFFTKTEAITESRPRTDSLSSHEASSKVTTTDLASSIERNSTKIESTTTTTKMLNVTVTISTGESTISGLTLPSTTYLAQTNDSSHPGSSSGILSDLSSSSLLITQDKTTTITVIPQQSSSEASTEGLAATLSEEHLASGSLASGTAGTITTQSTSTETSISESMQRPSQASGTPIDGTLSLATTTKYFTSTVVIPTSSSGFSNSSDSPSFPAVASDDSSGAGTGESSAIVVSVTDTFSTIITKTKTYTPLTFTSFATNSSVSLGSIATLSGSPGSEVTIASASTSSETLFASTALPVNATSRTVNGSFTVITVGEGSIVTIFPGGIIPTGSATSIANSSVSTDDFTSSSSRFNSSTFGQRSSFSSQTNSLFDWPTSTLIGPQTSQTTPEFPSFSFPTSWVSIITTPMTPPSVTTTSTRHLPASSALGNITVIKTTWTSTITTSLSFTSLVSSGNVTAVHTTSGYNFSKTLASGMNTFKSWSTFASLSDISSSIISGQPTNVPFPTNRTIEWQSTASSMPLSQSAKTTSSQDHGSMSFPVTSGFNSTAPYVNSTLVTTKFSKTNSSSSRGQTPSIINTTTFRSRNTTSTTQWFTNSTARATVTATNTESETDAGTLSLSGTTTITPLLPPSLNVTTRSGHIITKTFKGDPTVSILTPPFFVTLDSTTLSMVLTSTPPFPVPSNVTMTGAGVSQSPSGTMSRPTITTSMGELPTPSTTVIPSIRTTYRTVSTTSHVTMTELSTSASGTSTPLFPVSNSTSHATVTFSSIASWTPDPEPWTTWSTMNLTHDRGSSTFNSASEFTLPSLSSELSDSASYTRTTTLFLTTTLPETSMSQTRSIGNQSSEASESTSYTRTTTVFRTTTLAGPSTSQSAIGNLSSGGPESISYTRTTTVYRTTTLGESDIPQSISGNLTDDASLSISHTSTATLFLTTTSLVSGAEITSSAVSTWANTTSRLSDLSGTGTLPSADALTSLLETRTSFLTTGSAKGISTSMETSALTPFPVSNSTLSQASGRTSLAVHTLTDTHSLSDSADTASPCESVTASSSTCTDSVYSVPSSPTNSASTVCLTAAGGTTSSWSYLSASMATDRISSTCNTTSSMSSYSTAHWSNMTHTVSVKDTNTNTYQPLTTLRTVTKARTEESSSVGGDDPAPTDRVPDDPNFPWGNDSPIHRHQNSSEMSFGTGDVDGGLSKRIDWRLRWENIKDKLKGLWRGQALETGG